MTSPDLHEATIADTSSETEAPVRGKRERTKTANRDAILEAARRVFAELGFEATTVRDIVRGTDLASGTFYNYFKSKEEVFEALASASVKEFRPLLGNVRAEAVNFETYLRGAFQAYFSFLAGSNADAMAEGVPHVALIGIRVDTPEMKAVVEEIRADVERVLEREGHTGFDSEYLTAAAVGLARELGDCMLKRLMKDRDPNLISETTDFATGIILNGVGKLNTR